MIYGAGVDVGSTQTKAVIVDESHTIVARSLIPTGANVSRAGENAFVKAYEAGALPREAVGYVVGTGYGRYKILFGDAQITEITCHARGAQSLFPATRTVIDMGGQDTKVIKVGPDGSVADFSMNDKCAAGTGRFLSAAADVTGVGLDEIGSLVGVEEEVTFTGGVSRNIGMVRALEEVLGTSINVSDEGHFMGALGAALFALERAQAGARGERVAEGAGRT